MKELYYAVATSLGGLVLLASADPDNLLGPYDPWVAGILGAIAIFSGIMAGRESATQIADREITGLKSTVDQYHKDNVGYHDELRKVRLELLKSKEAVQTTQAALDSKTAELEAATSKGIQRGPGGKFTSKKPASGASGATPVSG